MSSGGIDYTPDSGLWNVGTVLPGDSAILDISARVEAQGIFFNVAEIQSMNEEDTDSWPGDGKFDQDDIASTCFSVPLDWYAGMNSLFRSLPVIKVFSGTTTDRQ
ncbi:hypothetical protein [Salmonirosea aquatica]|uniref:hypothetical protein n=1 Tax=Salmonirosea aquatica TaxID=2654236 RepID=UPI003571603E